MHRHHFAVTNEAENNRSTYNFFSVIHMNVLPVAGFLAVLVLTTVWFDQLGTADGGPGEGETSDDAFSQDRYMPLLHLVFAGIWGLLGAALMLLSAMQSPDTVQPQLMLLGCGLALCAGIDVVMAVVKGRMIGVREVRWLLAGIIAFGSTTYFLQSVQPTAKEAQLEAAHRKFAEHRFDLPQLLQ